MGKKQRAEQKAKELILMYFNNLDNLYDACEKIAKEQGVNHIELPVLKAAINSVKAGIRKGYLNG